MSDQPSASPTLASDSAANAAAFSAGKDDVFARIAGRYDLLCDIFSLMAHRLWKAHMARLIANVRNASVLDVASGTGDIPYRVLKRLSRWDEGRRILVTDLCPQMLELARKKIGAPPGVEFALADAHDLRDIPARSFDVFSMSFGMKICDRRRVIAEAWRVLRPGGIFLCLEAARIPLEWLHQAYLRYMDWCLPTIARLATGNDRSAYDYLLRGIHGFPSQAEFAREIEDAGFIDVRFENLTFGIVALHRAVKPSHRIGPVVDGWCLASAGPDHEFMIRGVKIFQQDWRASGSALDLPHPLAPDRTYRFDVVEVGDGADPVRFAAAELSPGRYGIYIPISDEGGVTRGPSRNRA